MDIVTNMLGGLFSMWLNVAFVVCVFTVLIFRPERIGNIGLFRAGCCLFILSLIMPAVGLIISSTTAMESAALGMTRGTRVINLLTPLLYAIAFYLTVTSLLPKSDSSSA